MYNKNIGRKNLRILLVLAIVGGIAGVIFGWALPAWLAELNLDKQMYANKAGVDFIRVNLLNWAELWVPLIPATIATVILLYPKKFLDAVPIRKSKYKKLLTYGFSGIIFGATYGISWFFNRLSYGVFMSKYLSGDSSFVPFFSSLKALFIPFNPGTYDTNVLLTWKYISLPIIYTILTAVLVRVILGLIGQRLRGGYPMEFLGRIFLIVGIIMTYFFFSAPLGIYDSVERTWLYIVPLLSFTFSGVGIFCMIFSKTSEKRINEEIAGASFLLTIIVAIGMIVVPCIVAAGDFFAREKRWEEIVWNGKIQQQVHQTRIASDLTGFDYPTIDNLTNQLSNDDIIDRVRQFDKGSSREKLENQIDTLYETKDDTDIINLNGSEYWIAPKSFNGTIDAFGNAFNRHVVYTHTEGFVAMDAHTGDLIKSEDYNETFGVNSTYPIYFGEGPRQDIILNVSGYPEIQDAVYSGAPDASLSGIQGWWKDIGLSFSFLPLASEKNFYLRRTNIFQRVGGMLLPYMYMDSDPYIVFGEGKMFYSIGLYISLPGFAYYKTNYKRFLGWVIVDVADGSMLFYESPSLDDGNLISFAKVYIDHSMYPWIDSGSIPEWLENQLRYPEGLYESQLQTDYQYHVQEWNIWKQRSDLFERPENGDLYYIIMDLGRGDGLEFVGVDLVKPTSGTTTLAGMYVLRLSPSHFGETIFYDVEQDEPLIGPTIAQETFAGSSGISENLELVPGLDFGNILLYPFAGSLYYVIPVYSTTPSGLQELNYVGAVNGLDPDEVIYGNNTAEVFDILKELHPDPGEYGEEDIDFSYTITESVTSPNLANITISTTNLIENYSWDPGQVAVNMTVYSQDADVYVNGSTSGFPANNFTLDPAGYSESPGTNYTIANFTLNPTETKGMVTQVDLPLGNFSYKDLQLRFVVTLDYASSNDTIFIRSPLETIRFQSSNYPQQNITADDVVLSFTLPANASNGENASLQFNLLNNNTNFGDPAKNVKVNISVFYSNTNNVSFGRPGFPSIPGENFTNDPYHDGNGGINATVINEDLATQSSYGTTILLGLDITGAEYVELVYYIQLIVDDSTISTTELHIMTWT